MIGIILAAGYGTRLGKLGEDLPKALLPVGDRTILDHLMDRLTELTLKRILVVTNAKFHSHFERWSEERHSETPIELLCDGSNDPENRLGAIRDLGFALESLDEEEPLLVSASDNLYTSSLRVLVEVYEKRQAPVVAMVREPDPERLRRTGVAELEPDGNRIIRFVEKPETPPSNYACPALYVYPPDIRADLNAFLSDPDMNHDAPGHLVAFLAGRRPVYGVVLEGRRYDVGSVESYREALKQEFGEGMNVQRRTSNIERRMKGTEDQ